MAVQTYILQGFQFPTGSDIQDSKVDHSSALLVQRLMDFGLFPGIEFKIIKTIPLSKVTVIQFYQTLLALNEQEFKCLKFS